MKYRSYCIFDGKTTICEKEVDFRIWRIDDEVGTKYFQYEINPEIRDENQLDFHRGETQRGGDLDTLLFRLGIFKDEFHKIVETRENPYFTMEESWEE